MSIKCTENEVANYNLFKVTICKWLTVNIIKLNHQPISMFFQAFYVYPLNVN